MSRLFDRLISRAVERGPSLRGHRYELGIPKIETALEPATPGLDTTERRLEHHADAVTPAPAEPAPGGTETVTPSPRPTTDGDNPIRVEPARTVERARTAQAADAEPAPGGTETVTPSPRPTTDGDNPIRVEPARTVERARTAQAADATALSSIQPPEGPPRSPVADRPIEITVEPSGTSLRSEPILPTFEPAGITGTAIEGAPPSDDVGSRRSEPATARPLRRRTPLPIEPEPRDPAGPTLERRSVPVEEPAQVTVTIGRIEVPATAPRPSVPPPSPPAESSVHLTLRDYMARKNPHEQ